MIEFEDAEHEQLMRQIAGRLGFDLVSHRMELFGRRNREQAPGTGGAPGTGTDKADPEAGSRSGSRHR